MHCDRSFHSLDPEQLKLFLAIFKIRQQRRSANCCHPNVAIVITSTIAYGKRAIGTSPAKNKRWIDWLAPSVTAAAPSATERERPLHAGDELCCTALHGRQLSVIRLSARSALVEIRGGPPGAAGEIRRLACRTTTATTTAKSRGAIGSL